MIRDTDLSALSRSATESQLGLPWVYSSAPRDAEREIRQRRAAMASQARTLHLAVWGQLLRDHLLATATDEIRRLRSLLLDAGVDPDAGDA